MPACLRPPLAFCWRVPPLLQIWSAPAGFAILNCRPEFRCRSSIQQPRGAASLRRCHATLGTFRFAGGDVISWLCCTLRGHLHQEAFRLSFNRGLGRVLARHCYKHTRSSTGPVQALRRLAVMYQLPLYRISGWRWAGGRLFSENSRPHRFQRRTPACIPAWSLGGGTDAALRLLHGGLTADLAGFNEYIATDTGPLKGRAPFLTSRYGD